MIFSLNIINKLKIYEEEYTKLKEQLNKYIMKKLEKKTLINYTFLHFKR